MMNYNSVLDVASFYDGRSIFITGATGFVGKVLIEKLLRSCSGIKHIYILLREKHEKTTHQRLEELFSSKAFDLIKTDTPGILHKVVGIAGDVSLPNLGISNADINLLTSEVSVVFHAASTAELDEPLKQAININVLGTKNVIELCQKMSYLVAIVHVSTAYANCDKKDVEEMIYPSAVLPSQIIETAKWMSDDTLESITPKLVGKFPNTYTYTKALAENLYVEGNDPLPVAIIRPSIITASWKEPYPGWIDNMNAVSGIIVAVSKGMLRSTIMDKKMTADLIPVDVVANLMITIAWYTAVHKPKDIMVYHSTSGIMNKVTWKCIMENVTLSIYKYPPSKLLRYPKFRTFKSPIIYWIFDTFDHYLPAVFFDVISFIFFQKFRMLSMYKKLHKALQGLQYFSTHEWVFYCNNVRQLNDFLSEKDQEKFRIDIRKLNWLFFWENHVLGCRKFILKEDSATIPAARRNLKMRYIFSHFLDFLLFVGVWKLIISQTFRPSTVENVFNTYTIELIRVLSNIKSKYLATKSALYLSPYIATKKQPNKYV